MLPLIQAETVEKRHWLSQEEMADCLAISQSLPGAIAANAAIYIGNKTKGVAGALAATLGVILPAYLSILAAILFLNQLENHVYVQGAIGGIKAVAVALILVTAYTLGRQVIKSRIDAAIAILAFLIIVVFGQSAIFAILLGGLIGFLTMQKNSKNRKNPKILKNGRGEEQK